jgi:bifunctional aspartokinase / homoserine dehydrogenase 1
MSNASKTKRPLRIMKFGGTSVGDAAAIRNVAEIVRGAVRGSELVVVVSAMAGVTNQLLDAGRQSAAGNCEAVKAVFDQLRTRHRTAIRHLIHSAAGRGRVNLHVEQIFQRGEQMCEAVALRGELSPEASDAISSLGERLSAPILSAALAEYGVTAEALAATALIRTDACHGSAEPHMDATRELCEARLRPLLESSVVPVVTGFIGANADGALTTLGRGGSDYSATILGAALDADEVTIWTDVGGLMTADPRLVPSAKTIGEISYREAAELARFGAKVLHPRTLSAVAESGIPIWIRNTFAPAEPGTKITPAGAAEATNVTGLAAANHSSNPALAIVTAVGRGTADASVMGRALTALAEAGVDLASMVPTTSNNHLSFVVTRQDLKRALMAMHREFHLERAEAPHPVEKISPASETWIYAPAQGTASAD